MDFNAQIDSISPEQLDSLFESQETTTDSDSKEVPVVKTTTATDVPFVDNLDDLDEIDEPKEEDEDPKDIEDTKDKKAEDKDKKPEDRKTKDEEPIDEEGVQQIKSVLKNTVNYLVDKGLWKDFDGREELELDEELYAELSAKQEEAKVAELFDELVNSTGLYGKSIINHIKRGGNPDEIIDIFKEQKSVQNFDIQDIDGQTSLVEKYYKEVVGWNKSKIDKYINNLRSEEDGLEEEAKDVQSKFDKIYESQLAELEEKEESERLAREENQKRYKEELSSTIDTSDKYTDHEKKLIKNSLLKFDKKLQDGTPINSFYLRFAEIQKDPAQYADLVHFVMDREGYDRKKEVKTNSKAVEKTWNFVKGNASIKRNGVQTPERDSNKTSKIDFSGLLKRK